MDANERAADVYAWGDSLERRSIGENLKGSRTGVEMSMVVGSDRLEKEMEILRGSGWDILSSEPFKDCPGFLIEARRSKKRGSNDAFRRIKQAGKNLTVVHDLPANEASPHMKSLPADECLSPQGLSR